MAGATQSAVGAALTVSEWCTVPTSLMQLFPFPLPSQISAHSLIMEALVMKGTVSPHVSYHIVSPIEQVPISDAEPQKLPQQHHRSFDNEDEGPAGHRASYLIPRKPVFCQDAVKNPNHTHIISKPEDFNATRQPSGASPEYGTLEVFSIWWLEMVCCAIFTGAFLAILTTIYSFEGRPLPEWPYHLTINTLIAIYVVILKAALLLVTAQGLGQLKWQWFERERPLNHLTKFDDASRGPWGSLILLWTLKARHIIASCGAIITVAALLIDPFTQQVVSSYQCIMPVQSSQASIPKTNYFAETGEHVGAGENTLPIDLQDVINAGIFNPGTQVSFNCPSGNCTFSDLYHSVGYCGSCNDTTNSLLTTREIVPGGISYTNISLPGHWKNYPGLTSTFWVPPETALLNGTDTSNGNGTVYSSNTAYLLMDYQNSGTVVVSQVSNSISTSCSNSNEIHWGCEHSTVGAFGGIGAAYCGIVPCVKSYRASVTGGRLSEAVVSTNNLWIWDTINHIPGYDGLRGTINIDCLPPETYARLSQLEFKLEANGWFSTPNLTTNDTNYLTQNFWVPSLDTTRNISIPASCVYMTDYLTDQGIQQFLETYLNGTVGIAAGNSYVYDYAGPAQLLNIYNNSNIRFEDLNSTFTNISDSLTQHIRQQGVQNFSSPAYGAVLHEQTCVHVRWAWLAYPAVLVVLTLIFLPAMIFMTRRGETKNHDWKSEPLALIFHRLEDETITTTEAGMLVKRRDMQDTAKQIHVRLGRKANGWAFVGSS